MIITSDNKKIPGKIVSKLIEEIPQIVSVYQNINLARGHEILGRKNMLLKGREWISDKIGKFEFRLYPGTFFQVNSFQTDKLYRKALEYLDPDKNELIVDAYGGIGTIGSYIAEKAEKVISIDEYRDAEKEGKIAAEANGLKNMEFRTGRVEDVLPELKEKIDGIILDPPRGGCKREVLETIIEKKVPKIVYVSCNPSTLGRDLRILAEEGDYVAEKVRPVDMFPQTSHVEVLTLLTRNIETK